MLTQFDYALLARASYEVARVNAVLPAGWHSLEVFAREEASGFAAQVFQSDSNPAEIVISFRGTDELSVIDWLTGNLQAITGHGLVSLQAEAAMRLVSDVQAAYGSGVNITFTGHSLGGGLASMMAVFFDRPAYVFDEAPFERSVVTKLDMGVYWDRYSVYQSLQGRSLDSQFAAYYSAASNGLPFGSTAEYLAREQNVHHRWLGGEILEPFRQFLGYTAGEDDGAVDIGTTTLSGALDVSGRSTLHDLSLLTSMLGSSHLRIASQENPRFAGILHDGMFYSPGASAQRRDFLANLMKLQVASIAEEGDRPLDRFGLDLQAIGRTALGATFADAMVKAAMDHYYAASDPEITRLVANVTGGVEIALDAITPDAWALGRGQLAFAMSSLLDAPDAVRAAAFYPQFLRWFVASGELSALVSTGTASGDVMAGGSFDDMLSAGDGKDLLIGGSGADSLQGGAQEDMLVGGDGNDVLIGGAGADYVSGGSGTDRYVFSSGDGRDERLAGVSWCETAMRSGWRASRPSLRPRPRSGSRCWR